MKTKKYLSIIVIICIFIPFSNVLEENANTTTPLDQPSVESEEIVVDLEITQRDLTIENKSYSGFIDVYSKSK